MPTLPVVVSRCYEVGRCRGSVGPLGVGVGLWPGSIPLVIKRNFAVTGRKSKKDEGKKNKADLAKNKLYAR
jgi:hypothetical protein